MALTAARSGIARAGATRSGYPIAQGVRMPLYALSGVARSGAIRSNDHSPKVFVSIAGVQYAYARADDSTGILELSVTDTLNETPNTATCRTTGFAPTTGQDVIVTLGSINNLQREFGGQVLASDLWYISKPSIYQYQLRLIDYTWGLNKRKVSGYYTGSASTIAQSLISTYASGYAVTSVEAGMPTVDGGITFTNEDLTTCLTRLMKRVGGNWYCDYHKDIHAFLTDTWLTNPTVLNAIHPSLAGLSVSRDLSQAVTRVYIEGGGVNAAATCAAGETRLPVDGDATWYPGTGGVVVCGPQRVTYTGVSNTGGGGLVGTGAAPSGAPVAALVSGTAGVDTGAHDYAVTFVTGAGESIAGPRATLTTGLVPAPSTAPTAAAPTIGTGPDPGSHDYAVTFVTSSGETTAGPSVTKATTETAAPVSAPTPGTATPGGSVTTGNHDYAVTFVTAIGETTPGPISAQGSTGITAAPSTAPVPGTPTMYVGSVDDGVHDYAVTFVTAAGETTLGPSGQVAANLAPDLTSGYITEASANPGIPVGTSVRYRAAFVISGVTKPAGLPCPAFTITTAAPAGGGTALSGIPLGPAGTTSRKIYEERNGNGVWKRVWTISNNTDTADNVNLTNYAGDDAPVEGGSTVGLSSIPTGAAGLGVTARKIYRRFNGAGTFKLLTTLANNTTTSYTDTTANASLGADAPSTNTATTNTIPLTDIPRGSSEVTSRKLYRRSGGLGLKFLAEIANNTATTYSDTTANASLGAAPPASSTAYLQRIALSAIPTGTALTTSRKVYRTAAGGAQLKLLTTLADNTTTTFLDTVTDASLGANVPTSNTATANHVALTAVPIGASAVTSRKVYRTEAATYDAFGVLTNDPTQLKLLATIADNTTATYADSTADASLGANVPTSDTSGLSQPQGNVIAGSTSLQVASIGPFPPSGWAVIGNGQQVIRYTGISGNVLTGIPATGAGAIAATIAFNSTVTSPPQLTGIPASGAGSILYPVLKGDPVNIFVQVDDTAAQTALAALIGGDGIQEDYIQDRRLAHAECVARGEAQLALRGSVSVAIRYQSRDINTRAGRTATVNLGAPFNITDTGFLIQSVTETFQFTKPPIMPLFAVVASSDKFSYDDLLRLTRERAR